MRTPETIVRTPETMIRDHRMESPIVGTYFTLGPAPCSLQIMERRRSPILMFAAFLTLGAGLAPTPAQAQDQDQESASGRTLAGHRFLPSSPIDDPFITTHIRTLTGAAMAKAVETEVGEEIGDSTVTLLTGDLAFLALGFEYQHGIFTIRAKPVGQYAASGPGTNNDVIESQAHQGQSQLSKPA